MDYETFSEAGVEVDTAYSPNGQMAVTAVRGEGHGLLLVVASLRDVWPLRVPSCLAATFSGLAPETYTVH